MVMDGAGIGWSWTGQGLDDHGLGRDRMVMYLLRNCAYREETFNISFECTQNKLQYGT